MPINPMFMHMEPAQRAGMAPRQEELGRWLRELESPEDAQGNGSPVGQLLRWLGERLAEYSSRIAPVAWRIGEEPQVQQKCRETDNLVRQRGQLEPGATVMGGVSHVGQSSEC
jgi:hypothetical protein